MTTSHAECADRPLGLEDRLLGLEDRPLDLENRPLGLDLSTSDLRHRVTVA